MLLEELAKYKDQWHHWESSSPNTASALSSWSSCRSQGIATYPWRIAKAGRYSVIKRLQTALNLKTAIFRLSMACTVVFSARFLGSATSGLLLLLLHGLPRRALPVFCSRYCKYLPWCSHNEPGFAITGNCRVLLLLPEVLLSGVYNLNTSPQRTGGRCLEFCFTRSWPSVGAFSVVAVLRFNSTESWDSVCIWSPQELKLQISLVLYMSHIILSMGILPIVLLKKSSSMVDADTVLSVGSSSSSLPKRSGWPGCAVAMYLLRVSCVWSWRAITAAASTRVLSSVPGVLLWELLALSMSVNRKQCANGLIHERSLARNLP